MNPTELKAITDSLNPTVGCRRISQGCDNCPSAMEAHRKNGSIPHYIGTTAQAGDQVDWTGKINVAPDHLLFKPLTAKGPTLFIVNSSSDLFGAGDIHPFQETESA